MAAEKFGKGLTLSQPTPVATILASPDNYVGKTVQVRGKVSEVCTMMGCWMQLVDNKDGMRIKVNDGEIMFPKNAVGKTAIAEGQLRKLVLSKEQAIARAKHEAEEQGRKFDPASVKSGGVVYQVQGTGAVLVD
jgi:hypothetical protein